MIDKDFVVSADGHLLEPTDLFRTRLPKHLRDRAVWEEDFEIEPLVAGGARLGDRFTDGTKSYLVKTVKKSANALVSAEPLYQVDCELVD